MIQPNFKNNSATRDLREFICWVYDGYSVELTKVYLITKNITKTLFLSNIL